MIRWLQPASGSPEAIRGTLSPEDLEALAMYAHRAFERAVSTGSPEVLDMGLLALLMSHPLDDWREWQIVASLFPRAAELLEVEPDDTLLRVGVRANGDAVEAMRTLLDRPDRARTAISMGWQEE